MAVGQAPTALMIVSLFNNRGVVAVEKSYRE
jgi:hypothetical protein